MVIADCTVLVGPELEPFHCRTFKTDADSVVAIERIERTNTVKGCGLVVIPGLCNAHTHMGDACLVDGTTGLTLEEGFFRPNGFKYRELARTPYDAHLPHVVAHLKFMVATGTVRHIDFREQGVYGSELLREAAEVVGLDSVVLGQFTGCPFDESALLANKDSFGVNDAAELEAILAAANGFSESTMNDLTSPAWIWIRQRCEELGKLRAIHCLENAGYRDGSLAIEGRGDLERAIDLLEPHLIVHMTVADAEEQARLVDSGITAVLNPRANANLGLPLPPVAELLDAGANLLLGTDNAMLNSPNMLAELDFTYKVCKSQYGDAVRPDPTTILKMATSNQRHAMNGDCYGYLDAGLPADFVVLDFSQPRLRDTRHLMASIASRLEPSDVLATFYRGRALHVAANFEYEL